MLTSIDVTILKWYAGAVFLFLLSAVFFKQKIRILWLIWRLPGPFAYPIIGNAHWAVNHEVLVQLGRKARDNYGPLIRAWITVFPVVFILEPQYIQKILSSSKHVEKMYFYRLMHTFLGEGLITCEGSKWRSHRKLIQPTFSLSILEEYIEAFSNCANNLLHKIDLQVQNKNRSLNVTSFVNECIVNILYETVLGIVHRNQHTNLKTSSPFRQGKLEIQRRWIHPWLLLKPIYRLTELAKHEMEQREILFRFTEQVIRDRKKLDPSKKNHCFIDYLIKLSESSSNFTEHDCINEICTFMLAGQDSVGAAVAFCLHLLAKHKDIQEKVIKELDSIFGSSNRRPTANDIREMKYLEQCLKETLRLYPSVPLIARKLGEDVRLGDYLFPEGCDVVITPFATHRLAEYYPDPEKFQPERFDPSIAESRHPYAFIPFSGGPRNCIGYKFSLIEMKVVVSTILRKYYLSQVVGKEEISLRYRITLRSAGGIWVTFTPREEDKS